MARAVVEGRKTVTRRFDRRLLNAQPGDLLLGKETWCVDRLVDRVKPSDLDRCPGHVLYLADGKPDPHGIVSLGKTRVSIHMPDWAVRIRARIVAVREEPLHAITREDAIAEGLKAVTKDGGQTIKYGIPDRDGWPGTDDLGWEWQRWCVDPREAFRSLWVDIHGNDSWNANPAVVRVEFAPEVNHG